MDQSKWLSPEQTVYSLSKKSNKEFLDKFLSLKDNQEFLSIADKEDRQKFIDEKVDEQFNLFNKVTVKPANSLNTLEWLDEQNESLITKLINKPKFFGRKENGKFYLNNEETLFLIESNSAICYFKSLQLSLQDAFNLMIKNNLEFERYMVFSYLLRFGFRIRRATKNTCFKNELKNSLKSNSMNILDKVTSNREEGRSRENKDNLIKRSNDSDCYLQIKRTKLSVESFQDKINIMPLKEFINKLDLIDENNELDFMKFIRFTKLNKTSPRFENWSELLDGFNNFTFDKSAFLVEGIKNLNKLDNFQNLSNDENLNELYLNFLDDTPLIGFHEILTDEQIKQRLANFGPQIDLTDPTDCLDEFNYDYEIYLPNKKQKNQDEQPNYYLKILHTSLNPNFPINEILKLNSKIKNPENVLFALCQSNELNFLSIYRYRFNE